MATATDPLRGWDEFGTQKVVSGASVCIGEAITGKVVEVAPEAVPGLERVQLFGVIIEETAPVYCFYDPLRAEWFSLSTGEQNLTLGIELVTGGDGLPPQLLDMRSGQRYPVQQGDWRLELSDNQVPYIQESIE